MCYVSIADPNFILVPENQIEGEEEEEFSHHSMCLKLFCLLFFYLSVTDQEKKNHVFFSCTFNTISYGQYLQ